VNGALRVASASAAGRTEPSGGAVPSPCISVCRIDPANGLCEGCLRTLDEIARWGAMNDEARRSVWKAIDARREQRVAHANAPAPARVRR
jgi:predicted Fe-S protein YdhL (DUF1289 family)